MRGNGPSVEPPELKRFLFVLSIGELPAELLAEALAAEDALALDVAGADALLAVKLR